MKISTKFGGMVLGIIASTVLLMFFTLSSLNNISNKTKVFQKKDSPVMITSMSLQKDIIQIQQWLTDISATRGKEGFNDGFDEAKKYYESAKDNIEVLRGLGVSAEELDSISKNLDDYYKVGIEMGNEYINNGTDAGNLYMDKFDPFAENIEKSVDVVSDEASGNFDDGGAEIASSINSLYMKSVVLFSIVIIISILSFFVIEKVVIKKLYLMINILKDISEGEGDLTKRAEISSKDEIGNMAEYFNNFADTVNKIVLSVRQLSEKVLVSSEELSNFTNQSAITAEEIAESIDEISRNAIGQARKTIEGSEKLTELGRLIEQDQTQIEILNNTSNKINMLIEQGLVVINQLLITTKESNKETNRVRHNIMETNESSKRISEASNLIKGIAEQTNLLALNASIEAAKAGEHGKGFAVVAEEIRELSEQSANSTKIIDDVVKKLQQSSINSVNAIMEVGKVYKEQIENVNLTESKYKEISEALKESGGIVISINEAEKQIEDKKNDVLVTIKSLSKVAEENSASTEQASASIQEQTTSIEEIANASRNLSQQFKEIQELIERFKV